MHRNENVRRMLKICLLVLLCNEMQSSFSHQGVRTRNYINALNGHVATADTAKYHASIRLTALDGPFGEGHICSGALIAPSVVLTAAHCLHNYASGKARHPAEFRVVMGTLDRYQRTATTLVYGVTHLHRPQTFEPATRRDDIGIMLLAHDVPDDHTHIQPIAFHMAQFYNAKVDAAATYELTSWSANAAGVPIQQLLALNMSQASDDLCWQRYGYSRQSATLCMQTADGSVATEGVAKACALDGGAPLLYDDQLWALTSQHAGQQLCTSEQAPIVYTDVAAHTKWIFDIIGSGHHQNSSVWGAMGLLTLTLLTLYHMSHTKL